MPNKTEKENAHVPCPLKAFKNDRGKWGFRNPLNGIVAITPIYDSASDFSEGLAAVELEGNWGYINKTGEVVVPLIYNYAEDFDNGHATVYKPDTIGRETRIEIDIDGTLHLETIEEGGLCGYADVEGNVVIAAVFDEVMPFSEGLAAVRKGEKWGYINKIGETIIPFIYKHAHSFSEGLAAVSSFGAHGYGYIDKENKVVIPFRFDCADPFSDGIAVVRDAGSEYKESEQCCINNKGELIRIADKVRHILTPFSNGRAAVATNCGLGIY